MGNRLTWSRGGQSTESAVGGAGGPLSGASIRAVLQGGISMETKTGEARGSGISLNKESNSWLMHWQADS